MSNLIVPATLRLCHSVWLDFPTYEQNEVKEIARAILFELISKTPPSHCRKVAKYKEQIKLINKLQLLRK